MGYLAVRLKHSWLWLITALIVTGVASARIYLGMHFLGDVIGGLIVGLIMLMAFTLLEPRVTRWIEPKPIGFQVAAAFGSSLALIVIIWC